LLQEQQQWLGSRRKTGEERRGEEHVSKMKAGRRKDRTCRSEVLYKHNVKWAR
jgi:hypothetical protein